MYRKKHTSKEQKVNNSVRGKRGFTLVELTVALAVLAILTAMVVSFSVLMGGYADDSSTEYTFLDDAFTLKSELTEWSAEQDTPSAVFIVSGGRLSVNGSDVSFKDGVLSLGEKKIDGLGALDGIVFSAEEDGRLIKCKIFTYTESGKELESSFVFFLRSATVTEEFANA